MQRRPSAWPRTSSKPGPTCSHWMPSPGLLPRRAGWRRRSPQCVRLSPTARKTRGFSIMPGLSPRLPAGSRKLAAGSKERQPSGKCCCPPKESSSQNNSRRFDEGPGGICAFDCRPSKTDFRRNWPLDESGETVVSYQLMNLNQKEKHHEQSESHAARRSSRRIAGSGEQLAGGVQPPGCAAGRARPGGQHQDRKSTRLNSSHITSSYAVFCLKKKKHDNVAKLIFAARSFVAGVKAVPIRGLQTQVIRSIDLCVIEHTRLSVSADITDNEHRLLRSAAAFAKSDK